MGSLFDIALGSTCGGETYQNSIARIIYASCSLSGVAAIVTSGGAAIVAAALPL